jgi:hypothetical protein
LIPGDINRNLLVDNADISEMKQNLNPKYKTIYDLNADGQVDEKDLFIIKRLNGFGTVHYSDTRIWILKYEIIK